MVRYITDTIDKQRQMMINNVLNTVWKCYISKVMVVLRCAIELTFLSLT